MTPNPLFYFENITKPTVFNINEVYPYNDGPFNVRSRPELGWTLDFIFSGFSSTTGNTFYYLGLLDEFDAPNYVDNNLSFDFTIDGRIRWKKMSYANRCISGNTDVILVTESTPILCTGGTSGDYNITIVFERNFKYEECCELLNEGGKNDLFTGWTLSNPYEIVSTTGMTNSWSGMKYADPIYTTIWTINPKWYKERYKRLGTLKIYLNGRLIYKNKNFEEIIPTQRQSLNQLVQSWGGGTTGSGDVHIGITPNEIKRLAYYEVPLKYMDIRTNYLEYKTRYDIIECRYDCGDYDIPSPTPTPTPTSTPTPTPTPSITPTLTPTITPSPLPIKTYFISVEVFTGATDGCNNVMEFNLTGYTTAPSLSAFNGYTMYSDPSLTTPLDGSNGYHVVTDIDNISFYAVFISDTGVMSDDTECIIK